MLICMVFFFQKSCVMLLALNEVFFFRSEFNSQSLKGERLYTTLKSNIAPKQKVVGRQSFPFYKHWQLFWGGLRQCFGEVYFWWGDDFDGASFVFQPPVYGIEKKPRRLTVLALTWCQEHDVGSDLERKVRCGRCVSCWCACLFVHPNDLETAQILDAIHGFF